MLANAALTAVVRWVPMLPLIRRIWLFGVGVGLVAMGVPMMMRMSVPMRMRIDGRCVTQQGRITRLTQSEIVKRVSGDADHTVGRD